MSYNGWEQMADWWDNKIGDDGDLWHRTLIDPPLIRLVGDVRNKVMLDLACGNGYLSRRFAREGAQVTGVDANSILIARLKAKEEATPTGIHWYYGDAAHITMLEDATFDIVICNMALMDIADAEGAIKEVARLLKPAGRFIASLSHPCFDKAETSGWDIEYLYPKTTVWRKISDYRKITQSELPWFDVDGQTVYTSTYHRPLSWYFCVLRSAGLLVANFEEPEPTAEHIAKSDQGAWIAQIPLHCVIEAWKLEIASR